MVSDLERYYRGERENALICYSESEERRAQGRNERPMREEQKRLAKADRKQRTTERRLQASRPNNPCRAEDSRPRGGRESIISITRSELTSSEPPGNRPDSVSSIVPCGDDYGGTEEEEEEEKEEEEEEEVEHDDSEEKSFDGNDRTNETVSGETDYEVEDHVDF